MALTQVKSDGIATGAVTADQIAANAVTVDDIADGSISTAKLADDAVTADKLADTAVTAGSYTFANVTVDAQGRITAASSGTVSSDAISEGNTSAEVVDTGSDGHFKVVTEGTEALRVDSSQRVGIGTTPDSAFHLRGASAKFEADSNSAQFFINPDATPSGGVDLNVSYGGAGSYGPLSFSTGGSTRVTIDSSGRLLVGPTADYMGSAQAQLQLERGDGAFICLRRNDAAVSAGNLMGDVKWLGNVGGVTEESARIRVEADATHGSGDKPGRMSFWTTADGASGPTARAVIDSTGRLNLSTVSQAGSFTRDASLRVLSGTITQNATFEMGNTGFTSTMVSLACERGGSNAYNFMELYSGRRYDNSSGDRETSLEGDGNNYCDGSWSGGGADYAEMFEWSDANPDAEDRRGLSVVLDDDKIREAVAGEDPIGVISGNPSVVGDTAWNKWNEKYLTDDFGSYQKETYSLTEWQDGNGDTQSYESDRIPADVTVPDDAVIKTVDDAGVTLTRRVLNPSYDPNVVYVPRKERPEWDCVGLMGKLRIRKGQVTGARWIKMRDVSDTVEEWLVR